MNGRESGHSADRNSADLNSADLNSPDPDSLEVVDGFKHQQLEGWVPELATPLELKSALEQAFDYRGNVLITCKNGSKVEGYVFDRRQGCDLSGSLVRVLPKDGSPRMSIPYSEIAALAFTGRDMAAGKSWETWVKKYWEKKAAGEKNIALEPEALE